MVGKILDGKKLSEKIQLKLKKKVSSMKKKPGLAVVLVGENPASKWYVGRKTKIANEIGIYSKQINLPKTVSEKKLLNEIDKLNKNKKIHGILVQLPLPKHINADKIISAINIEKDVDGFTSLSIGELAERKELMVSATPKGIISLFDNYKISLKGKHVVIVGESIIVGRPMALLCLNREATVTICNKFTKNLSKHTKQADIVISATGVPNLIKASMIKQGAIVVDVGTTKVKNKIIGDVDFVRVKKKAKFITPVPGGVGPMTVISLMENTVKAFELKK